MFRGARSILLFGDGEFFNVLTYKWLMEFGSARTATVERRCIAAIPRDRARIASLHDPTLGAGNQPLESWDTRVVDTAIDENYLIVEHKTVLSGVDLLSDVPVISLVDGRDAVHHYDQDFENHWNPAGEVHTLYTMRLANPQPRLVIDSTSRLRQIILDDRNIQDVLQSMSSRAFEELVAELLSREGLDVKLTPPTKDGGFDVLAFKRDSLGEQMYLVECKRRASHVKVGVEFVRQLYGVVETRQATAGLLIATSEFTAGARREQQRLSSRITLRDYLSVVAWLKAHGLRR
jgi:restriction system protein